MNNDKKNFQSPSFSNDGSEDNTKTAVDEFVSSNSNNKWCMVLVIIIGIIAFLFLVWFLMYPSNKKFYKCNKKTKKCKKINTYSSLKKCNDTCNEEEDPTGGGAQDEEDEDEEDEDDPTGGGAQDEDEQEYSVDTEVQNKLFSLINKIKPLYLNITKEDITKIVDELIKNNVYNNDMFSTISKANDIQKIILNTIYVDIVKYEQKESVLDVIKKYKMENVFEDDETTGKTSEEQCNAYNMKDCHDIGKINTRSTTILKNLIMKNISPEDFYSDEFKDILQKISDSTDEGPDPENPTEEKYIETMYGLFIQTIKLLGGKMPVEPSDETIQHRQKKATT